MKTYLPQIEPRKIVRPNITFGILNYDLDNSYPQRMLELIGQSPTAKNCWGKRAKFIAGAGFEDEKLGDIAINMRGLTLNKLRVAIGADKGLFKAFGIQINYNANYKKASYHYVPCEDIRIGNTDSPKYDGRFVIYNDWGRRTWKNILQAKLTVLDPYNPDPKVIKQQVIDAGGWDKWKGQLYYFNPAIDDYPLIVADEVWEDFETEAGIKVFNNREVTTGFLPSTILFIPSRREEADDINPDQDSMPYANVPSQFEKDLGDFQSAKKSQKIITIEYDEGTTPPEFHPYQIQNNDKLFEVTEKSVEARIIKGFEVPTALVSTDNSAGKLNNSGGDKKEAIREFNDNTAPERLEISKCFADIFQDSVFNFDKAQNWNILGIPNEVAEDVIGVRAGESLNELLLSVMPFENKIWTLVYVYGIKELDARKMVPTEALPQPTATPPANDDKEDNNNEEDQQK